MPLTRSRLLRGFVVVGLLSTASCEPLADPIEPDRVVVPVFERSVKIPPNAAPSSLRIMTWNIKFGAARIDFWFDGWGDRVQMTPREVRQNLDGIERLVREADPDVLFVNEIEVNSRRSAYVDMLEDVLEHTNLNYGAYYQAWNSRYIASEGVGRIDMGIATLSKYPIVFAERIRQEDQSDDGFFHSLFYLHTVVGRARLRLGDREVAAYVAHVSAYDTDGTKQRQLVHLARIISEESLPFVLGGDFNELPPTAVKTRDFADEHPDLKGTEFEQPPYSPEAMRPFFDRLQPAISLERMGTTEVSQSRYYSHGIRGPQHGGSWTRLLDYLFLGNGGMWTDGSSDVLQAPGRLGIQSDPNLLSDHAPVVGTWALR